MQNYIVSFVSPVLSRASNVLQSLFSTFEVVRNNYWSLRNNVNDLGTKFLFTCVSNGFLLYNFSMLILFRAWSDCWCHCFFGLWYCRYGDKVPKANVSKAFAIVWILTGLVMTGILSGALTTAITIFVFDADIILYGTKVGTRTLFGYFQ